MALETRGGTTAAEEPRQLTETEAAAVEGATVFADLGKTVLRIGGRPATDQIFDFARFEPGQRVLDAGCGVGTTAIEVASRFGCSVTGIDISPTMVTHARANVRDAGMEEAVTIQPGDITALDYPDDTFDRVIVEAVTMFVDRERTARELVRVCKPGGYVIDHEAYFARDPPSDVLDASQALLPGVALEAPERWVDLYRSAGLTDVEYVTAPVESLGPANMIRDEGLGGFLGVVLRLVTHPTLFRRMASKMSRAKEMEPYLDYLVVVGRKPTDGE